MAKISRKLKMRNAAISWIAKKPMYSSDHSNKSYKSYSPDWLPSLSTGFGVAGPFSSTHPYWYSLGGENRFHPGVDRAI